MKPTITIIQQKINIQKNEEETYAFLIHCYNCYAAVIVSPPRAGYDMILTEPCPICDGSEQSFSAIIVIRRIRYTGIKDISFRNNTVIEESIQGETKVD